MKRKKTSRFISIIIFLSVVALSACNLPGGAINNATPTIAADAPCGSASQESSSCVMATNTPSPAVATDVPVIVITPTQPAAATFTETDLQNMTYSINDFASVNGGSDLVPLVDGRYVYHDPSNPPDPMNYTVQFQRSAIGDLNADGIADAAVLLLVDTSGTGVFEFLAAVVSGEGGLFNIDTIYLGDRVVVESMSVQDGMIKMQMIVHGPQDAMCCPSVKTSPTYLLDNFRLISQAEKIAAPLAGEVIQALKARDMAKLAEFVDPAGRLRFSPYTIVRDLDQVFTPDQLLNAFSDSNVYTWGNYDGSGQPIQLTFSEYYDKFVYSKDFAAAPQVGYNRPLSSGNMIDNSADFYPNSIIVEYYFPATNDSTGAGLDWQSLKLVFQQTAASGQWYLVGIIHSQWTI